LTDADDEEPGQPAPRKPDPPKRRRYWPLARILAAAILLLPSKAAPDGEGTD
jgi:hypothetical protein